jgi:ribosomal peptide maturation radical SAM protein 1
VRVLFVNVPFASIRPAIGVSLLKAHLERLGIPSDVVYLNLRYAERIGMGPYTYVAHHAPAQALLGEWVFAPCLFPRLAGHEEDYLAMVRSRFGAASDPDPAQQEHTRTILQARREAEQFLDECMQSVDWGGYDLIGFTTSFNQNLASLALAQRIKSRFPHLSIIFGGANCEGAMGLQLHRSFPVVDFVCSGEADMSFPRLITRLRDGGEVHGIPGIISRRDGESYYADLHPQRVQDLDSLPYPDYADFFEQRRHLSQPGIPWVLMETSRGCWWGEKSHCTFCGLNGLSMTYRAKSYARALDEILALTTRHDTPYLEMVDNILDMQYFRDLLPELKRRGIALQMFYETKANLSKEQVRLLRDAGVTTIQPGIESLSTPVLRLMRKGTSAVQNIQLLKWCKEFGITCNWNIIYGFPGEDAGDYDRMCEIIADLHHLEPPSGWGPIRLDRFSPNFVSPERFGLGNLRPDRSYRYIYDLPDDALTNLAYYFEHDYVDGRDPTSYTAGLHAALSRWTANAGTSGLVYVDDGVSLIIQDFRLDAPHYTTTLTGRERAIYLFCDQSHSRQAITAQAERLGGTEAEIDRFLRRMLERHLMVTADGRYISLALPARPAPHEETETVGAPQIVMSEDDLRELRQKMEVWGQSLSPRERAFVTSIVGAELLAGRVGAASAERED